MMYPTREMMATPREIKMEAWEMLCVVPSKSTLLINDL
jgi:hypothetical protein